MNQPRLETLVADIYQLFDPNKTHEPSEDNLNEVAENLKQILRTRLAQRENLKDPLRFSNLGRPDRQLWYLANGAPQEDLSPKTYFKFLIGDLLEGVLLFLTKEAGHTVERQQEEIEVDGIFGHIDAIIDGTVVDVKTASPFGFKKFKEGTIVFDDPFGYIQQLSGYADTLTPGQPAAFLAYDKVGGDVCLSTVSSSIIAENKPKERIAHLREIVEAPEPPPRCYEDVPDGASGNMKLATGCSYCAFKDKCWEDANNGQGLRTFIYSTGPRYLTVVKKEPNVYEAK